ncbi:MAG: acetylglutamate kinase [Ferruginibacter sp.]
MMEKIFVIKIGGNVIDDNAALAIFLENFAAIEGKKILVHGGGKIATKIGDKLGIQSKYINGRRLTDAATIDLVTMVYGGLVNKTIVAKLQSLQCNAIGLTGADANIIPATKRRVVNLNKNNIGEEGAGSKNGPEGASGSIDYGFAGDISPGGVDINTLNIFLSNGFTMIVAPLTHDGKGQMLNTNADTIASALAAGLSKDYEVRLVYCFEKKGVLGDMNDNGSVIPLITKEKYRQLTDDNKLFEGIIPKIDNAFAAIENGVKEVLIGDANDLLQNVSANTCGTLIR